jgi:hypothetical protein
MRSEYRTAVRLLLGCASLIASTLAFAQTNTRLREGDLVEFEGTYGPVIGEVISGPDPSIYYLLAIPGAEDFAIHREKLRLLQRAGAPQAAVTVGSPVKWKHRDKLRSGRIEKVNGAWCRVEAASAGTAWIECRDLSQ